MQADWAVELGVDDETLEMPWAAEDGSPCYYDLKHRPELVNSLEEVRRVPELGEFLSRVNSPKSRLETAKCDAWASTEMNPEEDIFGATAKFCSYIDLLFSDEPKRFSFSEHEALAKQLAQLLKPAPEALSAAEFLVRRCYCHIEKEIRDGFYITFYLFGYGDDEVQSRQHWAVALKLVEDAIRQWSASCD